MKILLIGKNGQVGWELERLLPQVGETIALGRAQADLADVDQLVSTVRALRPTVIVNAAAYTAVDRAEAEAELSFAVNARAPRVLAEEAKRLGAYLIHFSTDYVFDGAKRVPYVEGDAPNPLSVYGASKLEGERGMIAAGGRHAILRTSWVYAHRGRNFFLTMLDKGRAGKPLRVVADQRGAPTWAGDLARVASALARQADPAQGLYHAAAGGETTWCGFAQEIFRQAGLDVPVEPITTAEYPVAARRPAYSVLDSTHLTRASGIAAIGDWNERLSSMISERIGAMQPTGRSGARM